MTPDQPKRTEDKSVAPTASSAASPSTDTSTPPKTKTANRSRKMMWIGAGSLVGVLLLFIIIVMVGVYTFGWHNSFTSGVLSSLRIPVIIYGSHTISYGDYQDDVDTLHYFYTAQAEKNPDALDVPTDTFIQKSVLSRLIREAFTADQANTYGVTVSQSEIDTEYNTVVQQATDEQEVVTTLQELYRWSPQQFKDKVLYPYLLRSKLAEKIATDDTINAEAKAQAESVVAKIKSGELSFEEAAKQYSDDTTASSGGDLGYFGKGAMVPAFEDAAFALDVDQVSDLVQTQYGYHIIKLTEKIAATDDAPEQIRASHILFQTANLDTWTNDQLADMYIAVLIKGYEWKDDCGLVLATDETCDANELLNLAGSQQSVTGTTEDTNTNADTTGDANTNATDDTATQPAE